MRHLIINTYHGLTLCVLLTLFICSLSSRVYGQKSECIELVKLYQSAAKQYKVAARQYLTEGCQEAGSEKKQCRGLEAAAREMKATVEMFSQRAQLLQCRVNDAQRKPQTTCERLISLAKRSQDKLDVLQEQSRLQRCADRAYAPPCRALEVAAKQPKEVVKAVRRQAYKAGCKIP